MFTRDIRIQVEDITLADNVVAVMGPTGAGKSRFIDTATRQKGKAIGHGLQSYTTEVSAVRFINPRTQSPFVLVDTPGFNDTDRTDADILQAIAKWLEKTCKKKVFLAGIIYLHRISDNRMSGTPLRNLQMFGKLCGDGAIQNVVLASTMWDKVLPQTGNQRETELKNKYWAEMLKLGSQTLRFVLTFDSAWDIIEAAVKGKAVDKEHNLVLLQEELVGLKRKLGETQAGRALYPALEKLLAEQRGTLRKLEEQVETEENRQLAEELKAQYEETEETITILIGQLEELKVPLGRRLLLFLNRPRNRALTIKG